MSATTTSNRRPLSARLADGDYEGIVTASMAAEVRQLEGQRDELLAACEAARNDMMSGALMPDGDVIAQLQAAIAKARST